ncbi:MAG: methyltransferase [Archaeoglobi archaeon]|nr:methyltransferase [Archaeoglobi archaeon]
MKKQLAILLEQLEVFKSPKLSLEQYPTPSGLAGELAVTASLLDKDVKVFADLGCGTGILAIAFNLAGFRTFGVDVDLEALKIAVRNAERVGANVDFVLADIRHLSLKKRVGVVMNPPFGIKRRHADRPFLEKALEVGEVVYSIHSAGSQEFVEGMARSEGFRVTHLWRYQIPLRRTYKFHEKPYKYIPVEVFRMERM